MSVFRSVYRLLHGVMTIHNRRQEGDKTLPGDPIDGNSLETLDFVLLNGLREGTFDANSFQHVGT